MVDDQHASQEQSDVLPRLSQLISEVQAALPEYFSVAIRHVTAGEPFFFRVGDAFLPLNYDPPNEFVRELHEILGSSMRFDESKSDFVPNKECYEAGMPIIREESLHEIANNLAESPLVLFIERKCWYVHIYEHGYFFPLDQNKAAEFIDYCIERVYL